MNEARKILTGPKGLFTGLKACLGEKFFGSAIVLAYSLIDVMAWLNLPEDPNTVGRKDFIDWAEKYVIPNGPLDCSGGDLYGARCGVLHTFTPDSNMAAEGKALRIAYSWGSRSPYPRRKLQTLGVHWIMIHIDTLIAAIERGAEAFWTDLEADPKRLAITNRRADKLFNEKTRLPAELP